MKKIISIILLFSVVFANANEIVGSWHGKLEVQGTQLRISFHISEDNGVYTTLMDSHDQGAAGLPTTSTSFDGNKLMITMKNLGAEFSGVLNDGTIDGTFSQAGMNLPLKLKGKKIKPIAQKIRPQDPIKPYKYHSEDVVFKNPFANNISLAGTLTVPNDTKNPPVAIMITGSGPQNRNEEIKAFNHRPFLVWSDYLSQNGIAVLRFDDRGVGKSEGTQENATSADFATDVEAAFAYLKTRSDVVDTNKIGLIGHSEGGLIAPMVVSKNSDVAFVVLLAGTGVDGSEVLLSQTEKILELAQIDKESIKIKIELSHGAYQILKQNDDIENLKIQLEKYFIQARSNYPEILAQELSDKSIQLQISTLTNPWYMYFIRTHPDEFLSQVKCPTLAINGTFDIQVLDKLNLTGIRKSLEKAQNNDITIKSMEGLNHLFQTAKIGSVAEYAEIEETVSMTALTFVTEWINSRFANN